MNAGNVVKLEIEPKTVRETYRKHAITVTYLPATGAWHWEIEFTARLQFDGEAKNEKIAIAKARKQIDKLLGDIV